MKKQQVANVEISKENLNIISQLELEVEMYRNEIKSLRARLESENVDNEMSSEKFDSLRRRQLMLQRSANENNIAIFKLSGYAIA